MGRFRFVVAVTVFMTSRGLFAQEIGPANRSVVADGGGALIVASSQSGKTLYGYSVFTGTWEGVNVINPDKVPVEPVVGGGVAYAVVGSRVYAFSAARGHWEVLELQGVAKPRLFVGDRIRVDVGTRIHVFSGPAGKWSSIDLAVDKAGR